MLVLSRKQGESVMIGDAEVEVVRCGNGGVRLGIKAPDSIRVLRSELRDDPKYQGPHVAESRVSGPHHSNESRKSEGPLAAEMELAKAGSRRAG
jgi:carbon storage regulator CsrA